jgi:hypothetical protein
MTLYDDDVEMRALLRGFMALALLPADKISEGFSVLKQTVADCRAARQLEPFVSYFENEWFGTFKPSSWSVNTNNWRTNNFAEGKISFDSESPRIEIYASLLIFQRRTNVSLHALSSHILTFGVSFNV